jgi:hypothetical protein
MNLIGDADEKIRNSSLPQDPTEFSCSKAREMKWWNLLNSIPPIRRRMKTSTVKIHLFRNHLNRKKGKQKPLN